LAWFSLLSCGFGVAVATRPTGVAVAVGVCVRGVLGLMARLCKPPAAMEEMLVSPHSWTGWFRKPLDGPTPNWPSSLPPQATTLPSLRRARLWPPAAAMACTEPPSGPTCTGALLPHGVVAAMVGETGKQGNPVPSC